MKTTLRGIFFLLFISITTITVAQTSAMAPNAVKPESISKSELQSFVKASNDIKQVQQQSVQKIQQSLSKNGMSFQRFRQIMLSKQNPKTDTLNLNAKEKSQFNNIKNDFQTIQSSAQKQMISKIKNDGLKVSRYQQIYVTLQNSKKLQSRVKAITGASKQK